MAQVEVATVFKRSVEASSRLGTYYGVRMNDYCCFDYSCNRNDCCWRQWFKVCSPFEPNIWDSVRIQTNFNEWFMANTGVRVRCEVKCLRTIIIVRYWLIVLYIYNTLSVYCGFNFVCTVRDRLDLTNSRLEMEFVYNKGHVIRLIWDCKGKVWRDSKLNSNVRNGNNSGQICYQLNRLLHIRCYAHSALRNEV